MLRIVEGCRKSSPLLDAVFVYLHNPPSVETSLGDSGGYSLLFHCIELEGCRLTRKRNALFFACVLLT